MITNNLIVNDACRLVHEVKNLTGREHWTRTVLHLNVHYNSGDWRLDDARRLIRRHVRDAKQSIMSSADTPAIELATDALLVETVAAFMKDKRECQHPRKQRQTDEYYCPACNTRWEASDQD